MSGRFALIVANNLYDDARFAALVTPGLDAKELAKVLKAPDIGGFTEVRTLIDEPEAILRREIARFFRRDKKDDLLLLYFSGHGVLDEHGLLYFATRDTEHDLLEASALPGTFIRQQMDRSYSRRQVLVLDCCHSGAFGRGAKGAPGNEVNTAARFNVVGYGRAVLAASDATQYAWEGEWVHGEPEASLFTRFLVQGLQSGAADVDGDGQITLDEWYDYAFREVVDATPRQKPQKFVDRGQGHLIIANSPRGVTHPSEVQAELSEDLSPAPGSPPYMGLQQYDVEDADLFFGRERLTAILVEHLEEESFLAVVGSAGRGKSSVVRAGLVPALIGNDGWQVHIVTPSKDPLETLAASLTIDLEATILKDDLIRDSHCLNIAVTRTMKRLGRERFLLVVDHFEELFILCRNEIERKAFIDNIMNAAFDDAVGAIVVVIILRADFLSRCSQYANLSEAIFKNLVSIAPMNENELRRAIEEPARKGDWKFESGLSNLILRDMREEPGDLGMLSHTLLETWKRRSGRKMTLKGYQEVGGVSGAIAHSADAFYNNLDNEKKAIARNIFLRLTTLNEEGQHTKRLATLDELLSYPEKRPEVEVVLTNLVTAGLVTILGDYDHQYAQVLHEELIREWPILNDWLNEDFYNLRIHRRLTETAQAWEEIDYDKGDLYRGVRLAQVNDWALEHFDDLNALESEFLRASRHEKQREARSKAGVAFLFVLLVLLSALAISGQLSIGG